MEEKLELHRLTSEMIEDMGFNKIEYFDEETGKQFYHFELPLTRSNEYGDLLLISNASDEADFPIIQIFGANEYEIHHAEPLIVLLNLLQSVCVVEDFKLDQQFRKDEEI